MEADFDCIEADFDRIEIGPGTVPEMCGRFTSLTPPEELAAMFGADVVLPDTSEVGVEHEGNTFQPNYNVAPSMSIFVVARGSDGHRKLGRMTWGLVPSWARERRGTGHVNARSETIAEKPSFRPSLTGKRCLIPLDGYYEWRTVAHGASTPNGPKRAVYVRRTDGRPMAVAGLWSTWRQGSDQPPVRTCCLITTAANRSMAAVHDRMPVVLEPEDWSKWLGEETSSGENRAEDGLAEVLGLLIPADDHALTMIDVGPLVNSVRNNGPELIVAVNQGP